MRPTRALKTAAVTCAMGLATATLGGSAVVAGPLASPGVQECADESGARVRAGAAAKEPALYSEQQAKQYGLMPDLPTLAAGSVRVDTVFHVITKAKPTKARAAKLQSMVD